MASPVDTSVKLIHSDMASAPQLTNAVGSLVAVLDAALQDGFGTKALTSLVVASGVATATWSGTHAAEEGAVVEVSGVTGGLVALNGEQKIVTKPNATSVTFATAAADGTASGTISIKMAAVGWTKIFNGTNRGAYKGNDPLYTGCPLRVDDSNIQYVRVRGYESMSAIDVGINPFPADSVISGGGYWGKCSSATGTDIAKWAIIGDGRGFYLYVVPYAYAASTVIQGWLRYFGDMYSTRPGGDPYMCHLDYSTVATTGLQFDGQFVYGTVGQQAFPRAMAGIGSSVIGIARQYTQTLYQSGVDSLWGSFPPPDGTMRLVRKYVSDPGTTAPRCEFPGYYHAPYSQMFSFFKYKDRVDGTGPLAGRRLFVVNPQYSQPNGAAAPGSDSPGNAGAAFIDYSGPWAR